MLTKCPWCEHDLGLPEISYDGELLMCNACERQVVMNGENQRHVTRFEQ